METIKDYKNIAVSLLATPGLLTSNISGPLGKFRYEQLLKLLLQEGIDSESLQKIISEMILACEDHIRMDSSHLERMLDGIFDKYWDIAWPEFARVLIGPSHKSWWGIVDILKSYKKYPKDKLMKWLSKQKRKAAAYVMMVIHFESTNDERTFGWSPVAIEILNKYADQDDVLNELSARLHSFSVSGSAIPLFEQRINMLTFLLTFGNEHLDKFAVNEINYFNQAIDREKIFHQNLNLGEL